jgi:hypothetical protein
LQTIPAITAVSVANLHRFPVPFRFVLDKGQAKMVVGGDTG